MTRLDDAPIGLARGARGEGAGFWLVAIAFLLVMAYSTVPTPLYPLYQQLDGFPVAVVTVIFAAYAVGVVASLFLLGHVSDWAGRRRMLVIAILVSALSAALFLFFTDVAGLITARFVNGVSIGILTATATAHLGELRSRARPDENTIVAASVSGAANLGGLALGPLIGGLFAQFLPEPLHLPHAVFLIVLLVLAIAVTLVPETVVATRRRYRPQRVSAPPRSRATFVAAGFGAFAGFAVFGLFTSLAPTILGVTFGERGHLLAGALVCTVFGSAAVAQIVLGRLGRATQLGLAAVCCAVGLVAIAVGAVLVALPLFIAGAVVAGVGVGVLFKSAIATAADLAEPGRRGETLALMFLIAYCGLALPVLVIGVALAFVPQTTVLLVFTALVAVATVTAAVTMRRRAQH
ncbi:MFS transporter [Microbacterium trichothecenolyticum]|uniref:MFS transporter n=1 Tax=Microbacterium ureisolvens TaxID=2781186 RepID=A0ABS7I265_9MICO|nr:MULTISPECIES: MFS transporter [Microbacterium]MBW9110699.1 MFS transporter [Microbacterium ureisolvens]MBW9119575.1 MFS transporter [Microbacterium trichothecenolyticum]